MLFSVVIPVFNSEYIVADTVRQIQDYFSTKEWSYEVILVNDGSTDDSWKVISKIAKERADIKAINLLRNYGQHCANLCGFREARGDYIITMDDDLQNPPNEIEKLISAVEKSDYDLVIGRFKEKKHTFFRRIGSKVVGALNRRVFQVEKGFVLTNFRIIRRDVIDRVCETNARHPYIPGLVLMFSSIRKNVYVEHQPRKNGKSNYTFPRILHLVATVLFNHSSIPLRLMAGTGFLIALVSFLLSIYYMLSAFISGGSVPGWATLVVLLSFFNGALILLMSVIGEYVVRLLRENDSVKSYYVKDKVS